MVCVSLSGLIPAHAGKTAPVAATPSLKPAHPRSRGENLLHRSVGRGRTGSSPLTRGKRHTHGRRARPVGLIPAHAGKTLPTESRTSPTAAHPRSRGENRRPLLPWLRSPAHPRSRGENFNARARRFAGRGSSPLTRGKHFLTCVFIAQIGQILESLELCASSESYSSQDAYATGAPQDQVRSIGLVPRSSRDAS